MEKNPMALLLVSPKKRKKIKYNRNNFGIAAILSSAPVGKYRQSEIFWSNNKRYTNSSTRHQVVCIHTRINKSLPLPPPPARFSRNYWLLWLNPGHCTTPAPTPTLPTSGGRLPKRGRYRRAARISRPPRDLHSICYVYLLPAWWQI